MRTTRTQVGIVGAGPAGLMLARLLHLEGIDSIVLERRDRAYVIERVRAGVLEQGTVDLLNAMDLGDRLRREGLRHGGLYLAFDGQRHRVDLAALTGGRAITIYGQNEVVKDLLAAHDAAGQSIVFGAEDVRVVDVDSSSPVIRYRMGQDEHEIRCEFIAGCDGSHGVCRSAMPSSMLRVYERCYPFAWLGILAQAPPSSDELVYSRHARGFALFSMRSASITRLYLQCDPNEDLAQWPDDRIWDELLTRLRTDDGWMPAVGPIVQKSVTPMRSVVLDPMQYGRLYLAGDAAHVVPPTGAKGLNLAAADVWRLAAAFAAFYRAGSVDELRTYSARGVRRAWWAQRFSGWMTSTLHRPVDGDTFDERRQLAELDYLVSSKAAMTSLAENYAGLPFA
ncbi:MAG TPA: 4-hydroxybenzoate 3-monooxygenase [Vicinamibacterales bacterium]|nr:4-hydroxybenzoate 3-monooxygenase [Vicinamibacterales bacterium]